MNTYKAAVFSDVGTFRTVELEKVQPNEHEVMVKVLSCAICTLEQRIYTGVFKRYPYIGGHEVAGVIESVGEKVKGVKPGDKVALRLLHSCGECYSCRSGHPNICDDQYYAEYQSGYLGAGGLAEYIKVPAEAAYKLSDGVNIDCGALAEPLACCVHSVRAGKIQLGEDVVVIGAGVMGLMHIELAKMSGARVMATEIDPARRELAKKLGADIVIDPQAEDSIARVYEETEGRGADVVLCTLAKAELAADSVAMLGKNGRAVYYSSFHPSLPITIDPGRVHSMEQQIIGALNPTPADFLTAVRLINYGMLELEPIISDCVPMAEIDRAFKEAIDPKTFRIVVKPQQ